MKIIETGLPGVLLIEPRVFGDDRGFFLETFQAERYADAGMPKQFVQDNLSYSRGGVVRGLHLQVNRPQAKLVQVIRGEVFDVAVDVRPDSPTFGRWVGHTLSGENRRQLYVPVGFAHGFAVTGEEAYFLYKCDDFYDPGGELTVRWDDPRIGIEWPITDPVVSDKDAMGLPLDEIDRADLPTYP